LPGAPTRLSLRIMNRFATLLIFAAALAGGLTGCQTTGNIAANYQGNKYKRLPSANAVELRKLPDVKAEKRVADLNKQGYLMIGRSIFRGNVDSLEQLRAFAASIGSDLVEGALIPVGTEQRSYMGIGSYTPGRTATTFGTASVYGSGTTSGNIYSSYGPMSYSGQSSGGAYGTSVSSTYIPPSITYVPKTYEVPIAEQAYVFYISPRAYLRNWMDLFKQMNASKPPEQRQSAEEAKVQAALFAQAWNVPLPTNLQPAQPVPPAPPELLAELRSFTSKLQF